VFIFCSWPDGRGAASPERTTKLLQPRLKICSYCREGGRDPVSPLGHRCSGAIYPHQPWRQVLERRNPR
jgi:hypothetical protein